MKHTTKLLTLAATLVAVIGLAGCSKPTDTVPQDNKEQVCKHEWNEGVVTTEPKCTVAGEKTFTCKICGETKTETIEALGHDCTVAERKEATCTEDGFIKYNKCTRCDYTPETEVIKAHHHEDYETSGYCETCGAYKYENKFSFYIFTSEDDWKEVCNLINTEEFYKKVELALNCFSFAEKVNDITLDNLIQLKSKYKNYKVGWFSYKTIPWSRDKYSPSNEPGISNVNAIILVPKTE